MPSVIAIGGADELAEGSLCAIGESILEAACEVRDIVDQIESRRLAVLTTASELVTTGRAGHRLTAPWTNPCCRRFRSCSW